MTNQVVYATDENYWLPLYVSLSSLLKNNKEEPFKIFVISEKKNTDFFDNVDYLRNQHDEFTIEHISVDENHFEDLPTPKHFTRGVYYRLLLGSLLPTDVDSVVYIDCDTLVVDSITEPLKWELDSAVAAAVPHYRLKSYFQGQSVDEPWYNTGVLYIDLRQWRDFKIEEKCIQFVEEVDELVYPIQTILNRILHEEDLWTGLSPEYNLMSDWIQAYDTQGVEPNPRIIHYTAENKPWYQRTHRPYKQLWWDYLEETPFRDYEPPDKNVQNRVLYYADRELDRFPTLKEMIRPLYQRISK